MKKSKFMQSSKDMLSRSFNPSKCKTSLRLAGSRLKLLRNKKEVQVKQMKREIAQLLESGQDQTARIRVEHVVREEKMMAAYDLIQIYCELIIARLPIIESQKNCPIDLKEAIASIIFASPRCGDVPELLDVKKQFTAKYGKDFATAAIEVRPACGVSRMLVEKLSAIAPDGPTKIKILTAIAEEHNVQWDHKSFDEKDPPNDLLSVPSTFGSGSQPYVDPSPVVSQDVQAPPSNTMHGSQVNVSYQDKTSPLNASTSFQHKERPPDRQQNWPMEFKDATSAAQAAAESAERASMAAKAAAEFANGGKITRQYSTESRYVSKDEEEPESYLNTKRTSERISEQHMDRPYSERTRSQNEQLDSINANRTRTGENFEEYGRGSKKVYSQSSSPKSKASIDEEFLDQGVPAVEGYCRKNSLKEDPRGEIRMKKQSFKHEAESRNEWPDKSEYIREEKIRKQPSVKSYRSHSSASDELNIFANSERPNFGYDTDNDSFVKGDVHGEDLLASVRFDKFDSDVDDHHGFDIGPGPAYDEPSQKSTAHLSINRDSWGVGSSSIKTVESTSSPFFAKKNSFSESLKSVNDFEQDNFKPVKFDDSDGPISDIDEEINMSKRTGIKDSSDHDRSGKFKDERGSSFKEKRYSGFHKEDLTVSSDEESKYMGKSQGKNSYADSPKKSGLKKSSADVAQPNDYSEELDTDNREGLNFEKLRGGFRHKGDKHSPFLKNQLDGSSSPKGVHSPVESPKMSKMADHKNRTTLPAPEADSDSDSSEEEVLLRKSSIQKPKIKPKLSVGSSNSIFGSDNSDLDEDSPKEKRFSKKSHFSGGISRRTKTSPKSSGTGTYFKMRMSSGALDFNGGMDKKPTTSYISEESDSQNKQESYERPSSEKLASKPARSNFWGPPEQPYTLKADSVTKQESKGQVRYEERDSDDIGERKPKNYSLKTEQESAPKPNNSNFLRTPERVSSESPQAATSNRTSSSKDDGLKRAGHVHPKLPDYDFLVQSLRINRS